MGDIKPVDHNILTAVWNPGAPGGPVRPVIVRYRVIVEQHRNIQIVVCGVDVYGDGIGRTQIVGNGIECCITTQCSEADHIVDVATT